MTRVFLTLGRSPTCSGSPSFGADGWLGARLWGLYLTPERPCLSCGGLSGPKHAGEGRDGPHLRDASFLFYLPMFSNPHAGK